MIFSFKQFKVNQADCAMKISSDACTLGALVNPAGARKILDIGTGTGLLALMIAQKLCWEQRADPSISIDALEIDPLAANRAQTNVDQSPFASMIRVRAVSLQQFLMEHRQMPIKYDIIVSNPPFFQGFLRSQNHQRSIARHGSRHGQTEEGLDFATLIAGASQLLDVKGAFWVLIPQDHLRAFGNIAHEHQLILQQMVSIKHFAYSPVKRIVCSYKKICTETPEIREHIRFEDSGAITHEERTLLKEFMLHY